jgi:hypothetical protein
VAAEPIDKLYRNSGDHAGDHQRDEDHRGQREEPDDPGEQDHDTDQEPGRESRVSKPAWCRKQTGELGRVDLYVLILLLTLGATLATKAAADQIPS